jgi:hypothetical protein
MRLARDMRRRKAGVGGTQPGWRAMPRSSRLAQCSMMRPPAIWNQCNRVMAKALPVGGKTVSTWPVSSYTAQGAVCRPFIMEFTTTRSPSATALGRQLLETGQLRDGISLDEVRDVLWNYLAIDAYERLVLTQGWPLERYSAWLAHAISTALCP